jgi:hypothetical protein
MTNITNGALVTKTGKELKHLRLDGLYARKTLVTLRLNGELEDTYAPSLGECLVNIEQDDGVLEGTALQWRVNTGGGSHFG